MLHLQCKINEKKLGLARIGNQLKKKMQLNSVNTKSKEIRKFPILVVTPNTHEN